MSSNLNPSPSGALPSPQQLETAPETWITASEAAAILHLTLRTVLSRAASGKLPASGAVWTWQRQGALLAMHGSPHSWTWHSSYATQSKSGKDTGIPGKRPRSLADSRRPTAFLCPLEAILPTVEMNV